MTDPETPHLTHFDAAGAAHMVDVSDKAVTDRVAVAEGRVRMTAATLTLISEGRAKKGDVLSVARLAGIMAAKRTADLIPLCHPVPVTKVAVDLTPDPVAALTVYDMVKAVEKSMVIEDIRLVLKDGGKSGRYEAK